VAYRCLAFHFAFWLFARDFTWIGTVLTGTELLPLFLLTHHYTIWLIAGLAAKFLVDILGAACLTFRCLTHRLTGLVADWVGAVPDTARMTAKVLFHRFPKVV